MQEKVSVRQKLLATAIPLLGLLVLWLLVPPVGRYFAAIVKLEEMRAPYTVTLFVILGLFVGSLSAYWVMRARAATVVLCGLLAGQLASSVAALVATVCSGGIDKTLRSIQTLGWQLLLVDVAVGFVLGGWLLGALLLTSYRFLLSSAAMRRLS